MKRTCRRIAAFAALIASLQLAAVNGLAATHSTSANRPASVPTVVSTRIALTPAEMTRYHQRSASSRNATHTKAAGASDNKALWIVGGVIVVAGAIALASGGGGGSGGGGY